jgi:diaminopimelate decarboxylase
MKDILPLTAGSSADGHLTVGGCDATELADRFGTPLVVFDRKTFEERARTYTGAMEPSHVHYAGKSFCCVAICQLVDELGLSLDVCSGGELATALAAGFPAERITFHGNNKSEPELRAAQAAGIGRVVVDSFDEIDRLSTCGVKTKLMIRVTPGVEAHTHEFVQTGQEDSKFGFSLHDGIALDAIKRASEVPGCDLAGLHAHIGSQIFELAAFDLAIQRLAELAAEAKSAHGFVVRELNLGGGLGIAHTRDELTPDPAEAVARMTAAIARSFGDLGLAIPEIFVEPGRSIVGPSAVTLYRIGTVKRIPGVRTYVSMDGGMSDNIRPALYGARYEAFLANRMDAPEGPRVTVAGKHCESGDILIKDVHLPDDIAPGDLLCVPATGAYTYAMASNYNRVPKPPVVMVENGNAVVIVERETEDDLLKLDRRLDGSAL